MSKLQVFSIRDLKSDFFAPAVHTSNATAIRWFDSMVNTPGTMVYDFPCDFELFNIGDFDSATGYITTNKSGPVFVISGKDVKKDGVEIEKSESYGF